MKMTLPRLPPELTEVGWKPQHTVFQNNTGLANQLRAFETKYAAVQKETPDAKFPAAYQELLRAHQVLLKAARILHTQSGKSPLIPKTSVTYVQKVHDSCAKALANITRAHQDMEQEIKAAAKKPGRGDVRVQLQQGNNHLWDGKPSSTSARHTVEVLNQLYRDNKKHFNDPAWEKALVPAIHKVTALITSAKNSGGLKPRGSGNQLRATFLYAEKEYRIDVEIHGDDDLDFFL